MTVVVSVVLVLGSVGGVTAIVMSQHAASTRMGVAPGGTIELSEMMPMIAEHYRFAAAHPRVYDVVPCFCGCESMLGHRSLLTCFVRPEGGWERHASGCAVCTEESSIIRSMLADGSGVYAIRSHVRTRARAHARRRPRQDWGDQQHGPPRRRDTGRCHGHGVCGGRRGRWRGVALGTVPLMVAVRPYWTLTNASDRPVMIGKPNAVVRQGCCPGPFTGGERTLRPGESTNITFELSMHPGMDGWHDMGVYVPVTSRSGQRRTLELAVTGDFTGTYQG
jgi:hypothetical protein